MAGAAAVEGTGGLEPPRWRRGGLGVSRFAGAEEGAPDADPARLGDGRNRLDAS